MFIGDVGCFWMFFTRTDLVEIRVGKKKPVVRVCTGRILRFETQLFQVETFARMSIHPSQTD